MQRIESLFAPLPRMVRDLSSETGKPVVLEIDGGDVELDREMIEMIRDPLSHIIRNAIGHGIESAPERRLAGKPESGSLRICAHQAGNQIMIEVVDDGRGIDGEALVRKAIAAGTLSSARAESMATDARTALIFEPGLSTAAEVTALSGRGVGMDVVRANIERIGGVVDIHSRPGEGVRITLRVPLTLTIISALTLRVGDQKYALPRSAIEEIVRVKGGAVRIERLGGIGVATIRDRRLPLVSLADLLGLTEAGDPNDAILIVVKPAGADGYALAVDQVQDHEELVVKPAAPAIIAAGLYAGTTLADDGRPVLLLDPPGLAARAGLSLDRRAVDRVVPQGPVKISEAAPAMLFRTLAGAKRLVPVAAVERIEELPISAVSLGSGRPTIVIGDRILPLVGMAEAEAGPKLRVLCLTDQVSELAYALGEVIDILPFDGEVLPAANPGEVRGVTLIGGEQVELLDLHWLFARHVAGSARQARPTCRVPTGDAWTDAFLRPIIESAGYRIVQGQEGADIVILGAQDEAPPASSGRILRLSAGAEPGGECRGGIDRYDRDALLAALKGARA
jgi:two-component system chemotaxis sensor kinase CheA